MSTNGEHQTLHLLPCLCSNIDRNYVEGLGLICCNYIHEQCIGQQGASDEPHKAREIILMLHDYTFGRTPHRKPLRSS